MQSGRRPWLFLAVSAVTTVIDVAILVVLRRRFGLPLIVADGAAIAVASLASFWLHRASDFRSSPYYRWVRDPLGFALLAIGAGTVDVSVLRLQHAVDGFDGTGDLVLAKFVAIGLAVIVRAVGYRYVLHDLVVQAQGRKPQPASDGGVRFSVVIPAYRAAAEIGDTIRAIKVGLADIADDGGLEVVVVDDGSDDGTSDAALSAGADQVVTLPVNRGKGGAVRAGMRATRGRVVAFTDADLAYDPPQLRRVLDGIEQGWDVVIGNRRHPESDVVRASGIRAIGSRVVNRLSAVVLLAAPLDTQCGLKGFRGDVARRIFSRCRVDGFAFDIEVLHLVERAGWSLHEIPVSLREEDGQTTVRIRSDVIRLLGDLVRVRRWASAGVYDGLTDVHGASADPSGRQLGAGRDV